MAMAIASAAVRHILLSPMSSPFARGIRSALVVRSNRLHCPRRVPRLSFEKSRQLSKNDCPERDPQHRQRWLRWASAVRPRVAQANTQMRARTFQEQVPFTLTGASPARWGGLPWVQGVIHATSSPTTARADASRLMVAVGGRSEVMWRQGRRRRHHSVEAGSITFMACDVELEQLQSVGDHECFGMQLDPAMIDRWTERGSSREALKLAQLPRHFSARDQHALALANVITQEGLRQFGLGQLYAQSICLALLSHVWGNHARSSVRDLPGGMSRAKVHAVTDYIWAHLGDDLSLDVLADQTDLSPSHFSASFRRATGVSPYQYLLKARIERSKELLRAGDRSTTDVALATGFSSGSHFAATFRKMTSLTPSAFRELG
ncbi:MAG: helix-turn-helix domain-containing protein [Comamonadaceae bacterium]|nr:MAG: helix-turn-helix domain-containing protein [Comamonadaceae bacterium]